MQWCDVPVVWNDIEKSKRKEDLRTMLGHKWSANDNNLHSMFYRIYWEEELIKVI